MKDFVHLHVHSHYSLLDACNQVPKLVQKAKEFNMPALALTDHGNLFGAMEFYHECKKQGIQPILGCEMYVAVGSHQDRVRVKGQKHYHHLILLVRNSQGYSNLSQLASLAYLQGFYYKPRVDKELLKKYSEGLIALSACLGGEIPQSILSGNEVKAKEVIQEYQEIFGSDYFFLELQDHQITEQRRVNERLLSLSKELRVPLVATNDVHYLDQEDHVSHDLLLCIGSQNKFQDKERRRYKTQEFYLKSPEEMHRIFSFAKEALENTVRIAELCRMELKFRQNLPQISVPDGFSTESYLGKLCEEGIEKKYSLNSANNQDNPDNKKAKTQLAKTRLKEELEVICSMGFASYFLIVWDFIVWAKKQGIFVGPGRGSAAGSIVAYALGITNIDPLRYHLLFERFLNKDRISLPDIDTDFEDERRDQVIQYVIQKYGQDKVAGIITFGSLKARAVIRDLGRVLDLPLREVDRIAKLIPGLPGMTLKKACEEVPELRKLLDSKLEYQRLFTLAQKLEGVYRHAGTHAAGIVISPEPLSKMVPLYSDPKTKVISTQYEGTYLEKCGLLKMDFLGLKNLSVIRRCLEILRKKGISLDIDSIPLDAKKAYRLLTRGESLGVFQLEGTGMQELMKQLEPSVFEDIIALIALYRPGPIQSGMVKEFIQRKHKRQKFHIPHPNLKEILQETYGVIVYQEQVMEIAKIIGGFNMAKSDELRKAMGKKQIQKMKEFKRSFVEGAKIQGMPSKEASELYEQMARFGEYGFNKSHSAAYALVTYQTAYLKSHYSIEYMTALLSCDRENTDKIVDYVQEAQRMSIPIVGPCVNESSIDFSVEEGKIRFGLSAIKNIGIASVQAIVQERERGGKYSSLGELSQRVDSKFLNKKVLESLIDSGAFDSWGKSKQSRVELRQNLDPYSESKRNQLSLFEKEETKKTKDQENQNSIPELEKKRVLHATREILIREKEVLGFYLSGHPLEEHKKRLQSLDSTPIRELQNNKKTKSNSSEIYIVGLLIDVQFRISKKGNEWALLTLEDWTGSCEVLLFNELAQKRRRVLTLDQILYIQAKIESIEPRIKLIAQKIWTLEEWESLKNINQPSNTPYNKPFNKPSIEPQNNEIQKHNPQNYENGLKNTKQSTQFHIQLKRSFMNHANKENDTENAKENDLEKLKEILEFHRGHSLVFLHVKREEPKGINAMNSQNQKNKTRFLTIQAGEEFSIRPTPELLQRVQEFDFVEKAWF